MREILAVIQRRFPSTFSSVTTASKDAELVVADAAALDQALAERSAAPVSIRCGELCLSLTHTEPAAAGPLHGQVILVTGAASGLGLGVARGLYQAGACVVLSDVDHGGLRSVLAEFSDQTRVQDVMLDVTDERAVAVAFDSALTRWGRIDGLACCAGVAPSYPLVDFPLAQFRLANEINLTGYFLCAREFARIAIPQGHGGSMVFLSSKSGLEPSKANSAYNATKAGELHMSRGWALELGSVGIRSNCIAPGNVFSGSKIWNADYIAAAAKKKGIRPDEVIPYYVGLTALQRDITPDDIANAAVWLLSDAARCVTGQVIVVDSGQVFAR